MPRKTNAKQEPEQPEICKQAKGSYPRSRMGGWGHAEIEEVPGGK